MDGFAGDKFGHDPFVFKENRDQDREQDITVGDTNKGQIMQEIGGAVVCNDIDQSGHKKSLVYHSGGISYCLPDILLPVVACCYQAVVSKVRIATKNKLYKQGLIYSLLQGLPGFDYAVLFSITQKRCTVK